MIRTTFLKSTVRPCASVSCPSSSICNRMLKTSGWAFSISSKRTTEYGLPPTCSVSWPPRRSRRSPGATDETANGVALHVLGHVEPDHGVLVAEEVLGEGARARSSRRPWARGRRTTRRPVRVLDAGEGPPYGAGDGLYGLFLPDDAPVQRVLHLQEPADSSSVIFLTGMPVHMETISAISFSPMETRCSPSPSRQDFSSSRRCTVSFFSLSLRRAARSNSWPSMAASFSALTCEISSSSSL